MHNTKKTIICCTLLIAFVTVILSSCKNNSDDNSTTAITAEITLAGTTAEYTAAESTTQYTETAVNQPIQQTTSEKKTTKQAVTEKAKKQSTESTTSKYVRTGESLFTEDKNNKYMKAVVEKYGLDCNNTVCIYTVPDADGNIVLEFDGSTDENGRYLRNADTLIAIYTIDKNMNSKRASENTSLNEYDYVEMKTMFFSTTKWLLPKFETELNNAPIKK